MKSGSGTFLILVFILLGTLSLSAQDDEFTPSRSEAESAWNAGRYEQAYRHYNGLLLLYSRDPLYKYFTGACLVKLNRDPSRAVTLLASAINSSMNVKSVPEDVWFYYGRALHQSDRLREAGEAYKRFIKEIGKRRASAYDVESFIGQCQQVQGGTGKEQGARGKEVREKLPEKEIGEQAQNNVQKEDKGEIAREPDIKGVNQPVNDIVRNAFAVNGVDTASRTIVPEDYDSKLGKALKLQFIADSMNRVALNIRREMETAPAEERASLKSGAEKLEKQAVLFQSQADSIFLTLEPGDRPSLMDDSTVSEDIEVPVIGNTREEKEVTVEDTAQNTVKEKPVYSVFEIRKVAAYDLKNPVPVGTGAPAGLVYRIQVAAFKNPVPVSHFRGLYPLYGKVKPENGVTYYYAGMFRTVEAARQALVKVRGHGFPDAFITAMMDDNLVSIERAAALEKDQKGKPLYVSKTAEVTQENIKSDDTVPVMTLFFRAEVMRAKKPVKPEVIEKLGLLAGKRGMEIMKNDIGETLYLIGKFITFESADEYVSLLIRNGYTTARVVAYLGDREISVEAARELFKKPVND